MTQGVTAHQHHIHAHHVAEFKRRLWVSLLLTAPILLLSEMIQTWFKFKLEMPFQKEALLVLSLFLYLYGGYPFVKGMFDELKLHQPGMMTLIGMAISVAFVYSAVSARLGGGVDFFWELATLVDIMLLGHWIEAKSIVGASRALEDLVKIMPATAHLFKENEIVDVPASQLKPGDVVLVRPGERIPSDGVVVEGESHVNEALLTGESRPVRRGVGDKIIGGAINEEGSLKVRIERTGSETFVAQVMRLIRQAQESRSRTQDLANRASALLFYIAMGSGVATFLAWHALGNPDIAIERMVTVLVVACPHALGLAIPLVVATSTSITSKSGILIRDRRAFEGIRDVDAVVFDKTGTLTQGSFGVTDVISFIPHDELLRLTSNVEVNSEHIIAKAIVSYARERGIEILGPDEFKAMPGKGVSGVVGGRTVHVGGPSLLKDMGLEDADQSLRELQNQGKTVVFTLVDGKVVGAFALSDKVREESREALRRLREMGVAVFMITGDSEDVARWVAKELGIENYFAQVLPGEKAERVSSLKRAGYKVAMVGDGINDAPALVTADVGIAIGAGTDVAIESADIILVRNDPRDVVKVIEFSKKAYSKMVQNLWWATGYNAFTIPLAAGALSGLGITLSPAVGALLMSLSTVIVAVNAQTLRKYEPKIQIKAGEVHTVIDPVCGMEVEPDTAYSKLDYEGNLIYFCSEACEKKFREDPNKYLGRLKRGERRYRF